MTQDFTAPAINDDNGNCIHCGRDNNGHHDEPCSDECPMYWEASGISHSNYLTSAA